MTEKPTYELFFVLLGLLNGEDGCRALTTGLGVQMRDGWYFITDDERDDDGHGPYLSREAAIKAGDAYVADVVEQRRIDAEVAAEDAAVRS